MRILREIEVERVGGDQIEIRWSSVGQPGLVSIYEGSTPDGIDTDVPVAQTSSNHIVLAGPNRQGRRYFKVVPEGGDGWIVSERFLVFEGISNFRDLGGYETPTGQTVRWGRAYRSGDLSAATEADLAYLSRLGIRTIFDLRHHGDGSETPDPLPSSDARVVALAVYNEEMRSLWKAFERAESKDVADAESRELYLRVYRSLVPNFTDKFAVIFQMMADPRNLPAVFHCLSGQDRTGTVAAILLMLLGVPIRTAVADYLLSNRSLGTGEQWAAEHPNPAAVESFFDAREEYLRAGIDEIRRLYGSFDEYAATGLGMTSTMLERLRSLLLSP
jgi:protein-tyrosine phosphatase